MMIKSKKTRAFTLVEIMVVVVIIGLLASIAIPAFNKVRSSARERAIQGNLRSVANAAQSYFIDNPSATTVTYSQLTSGTQPYLATTITPVADEVYTGISLSSTGNTLSLTSATLGKTITVNY